MGQIDDQIVLALFRLFSGPRAEQRVLPYQIQFILYADQGGGQDDGFFRGLRQLL